MKRLCDCLCDWVVIGISREIYLGVVKLESGVRRGVLARDIVYHKHTHHGVGHLLVEDLHRLKDMHASVSEGKLLVVCDRSCGSSGGDVDRHGAAGLVLSLGFGVSGLRVWGFRVEG